MHRRSFLLCIAGLVAGCRGQGEPSPESSPATTTDARTATATPTPRETPTATATPSRPTPDLTCEGEDLTTPTPGIHDWVEARADPTTLGGIAAEVVEPASELESGVTVAGTPVRLGERDVFARIRTGDTLRRTTIAGELFFENAYVSQDGVYYRVDERLVGEQSVTAHVFELEQLRDGSERERTARREALPFSSLSEVDKAVFLVGLPRETPLGSGSFSSRFSYHFETDTAADSSRFVSDAVTYIEYRDVYFSLRFVGTTGKTQRTFEYEASTVAGSESAFHDVLADVFVIDGTSLDLSTDARRLLDHILSCGHYTETPRYSAEVVALLGAFADRQTEPGVDWIYFLRHDGRLYELSLERH